MQCDSVKFPLSCVKLTHVELPCLSVVFSWHILAQMQGRAHEASHPPHSTHHRFFLFTWEQMKKPKPKSETYLWRPWRPKNETETFVGILKFWFLFMHGLPLSPSKKQKRFFFQVIITCPWVAGLTCCISESHQSIVYPWPQAIVGSPLTAWLTPIQENIWISEGQLISVRDVRQLLWTTLFLSLHKKGTCNLISRIRGALSLL